MKDSKAKKNSKAKEDGDTNNNVLELRQVSEGSLEIPASATNSNEEKPEDPEHSQIWA